MQQPQLPRSFPQQQQQQAPTTQMPMPQPTAQRPYQPNPFHDDFGTQQPAAGGGVPNLHPQQQTFQHPQQTQFPSLQRPPATYQGPLGDVIGPAPLQQGRGQHVGTPLDVNGVGEPAAADYGTRGEWTRVSRRERKKSGFQDRNLWVSGQSVVGRKGKDGEWMEVRCVAM